MRKFIYQSIVEKLSQITDAQEQPVIKHFDLWRNQLAGIEEEQPFELPAVLVELRPIMWRHQGNAVREAAVEIALHVLTRQNMPTSNELPYSEESLQFLDFLTDINRSLHGYYKVSDRFIHDSIIATQSTTDNDSYEIRHDIEVFTCHVHDASAKSEPLTIKKPVIEIQT
jgi:hypothetical protein